MELQLLPQQQSSSSESEKLSKTWIVTVVISEEAKEMVVTSAIGVVKVGEQEIKVEKKNSKPLPLSSKMLCELLVKMSNTLDKELKKKVEEKVSKETQVKEVEKDGEGEVSRQSD